MILYRNRLEMYIDSMLWDHTLVSVAVLGGFLLLYTVALIWSRRK